MRRHDIDFEVIDEDSKEPKNVWLKWKDEFGQETEDAIISNKEMKLLGEVLKEIKGSESEYYDRVTNLIKEGRQATAMEDKRQEVIARDEEIVSKERQQEILKVAERMFQLEYQMELKQANTFGKIKKAVEKYGNIGDIDRESLLATITLVEGGEAGFLNDAPEALYFHETLEKCYDKAQKEEMVSLNKK